MSDRSRWDPEMRAYQAAAEAIAARFPPVKLELPLEPHRAVNDAISMARGARGPEMAETTERWVAARGRRIYCRVHRPRTDRPLPWWCSSMAAAGYGARSIRMIQRRERSPRPARSPRSVSIMRCRRRRSFPRRWRSAPQSYGMWHGTVRGGDSIRRASCSPATSAGGNLALATALLLRDTGGPKIAGILVGYPVCDSRFDTPSYQEFAAGHVLTREKVERFMFAGAAHRPGRRDSAAGVRAGEHKTS